VLAAFSVFLAFVAGVFAAGTAGVFFKVSLIFTARSFSGRSGKLHGMRK